LWKVFEVVKIIRYWIERVFDIECMYGWE